MDHQKNAAWLGLVIATGLAIGSSACAAGNASPPNGDLITGAGRPAAEDGGGGIMMINGGSAAGQAGQSMTINAGFGAPSIADAAVVDASRAQAGRDAALPSSGATPVAADGGMASPSAGCAGSMFALCEDFETGVLDAKRWKVAAAKGTATLDSSRANRGSKYALHVHVDPGSDTTVGITESDTFPALKTALFARAFIFIPSAMSTSLFTGDRHSRLIYAQGQTPYGEYALGIWNGGLIQNHYSSSDDSQDTKMLPPFDAWFCLEYALDSAAGDVKAYLNDVEIPALRHEGWPASNIDTLMFGVDRYGSFPVAEDIWFDDLVVDSQRIGCTR